MPQILDLSGRYKNNIQNRDGLPDALIEEKRFFQLPTGRKEILPDDWNNPDNWKYIDDIPEDKYFGFAIGNNSNYLFIDGDHVRDPETGNLIPWVANVYKRITKCAETYFEISMSGTGFHMICDLGDYADNFSRESNGYNQIIIEMDPEEYNQLPKEEKDKVPKVEFFYHTKGRYAYLTGNHSKKIEVATDENAASIFSELLKIRKEHHARFAAAKQLEEADYEIDEATRTKILEALPYISANSRETWVTVGIALSNCGFPFEVWDTWSQFTDQRSSELCDKYNPAETPKIWKSFKNSKSRWNAGTIFRFAKENGWNTKEIIEADPAEPRLIYSGKSDKVKSFLPNYIEIIKHDYAGNIWLNALDNRIMVTNASWDSNPHPIRDVDLFRIMDYIAGKYEVTNKDYTRMALSIVAQDNAHHPIIEYLNGLKWDGRQRIANLFPRYLGAERSDYTTAATKLLLYGAIQRVFNPGTKFDYCIILADTEQGTGKSTMSRFLSLKDEWFCDSLNDMGDNKTAYEAIRGHWIVELGEMIATRRTKDIESIKAFISREADDYRDPYSTYPERRPRQCIFIGTTNKPQFLPDDRTGNRRFIPIICDGSKAEIHPRANEEETRAYINQCYAEALQIGPAEGWPLVLDPVFDEQLNAIREASTPDDSDVGLIQEWLDGCGKNLVCSRMIWDEVYKSGQEKPTRFELQNIADIMNLKIEGWIKYSGKFGTGSSAKVKFRDYGSQRAWKRTAKKVDTEVDSKVDTEVDRPEDDGFLSFPDDENSPF